MERSLEQSVADPSYLEFFGLTQPPFGCIADPTHLFQTKQYSLLTEHLVNATTHSDCLVAIRGADGSGKSTLINSYVSSLGKHIYSILIDEDCHSELQFYNAFLTQIGFKDITGTASELKNITKEFLVCRGIAGDQVLVIIDNAHLTGPIILEQLRWISEIKTEDRRVLSAVLAGNADLIHVIDAPTISGLNFGGHVVFNIRNYAQEETTSYVWHRLRLAGGSDGVILPSEASSLIHRYSGGIPQQINRLCNDMLGEAFRLETRVISEGVVRAVADKLGLLPHIVPLYGKGRRGDDPSFGRSNAAPNLKNISTHGEAQASRSVNDSTPPPGIGPQDLLKYVSQLSEQIENLRADKVRALQDIDSRNQDIIELRTKFDAQVGEADKLRRSLSNNAELEQDVGAREAAEDEIKRKVRELASLRDELALRNEMIADLEIRFAQSQSECESAQLHIATLKSPQELEAVRTAADKLAAELNQEGRARAAAENELASAATAVEELSQSKQKLQATVDDLNADLEAGKKVADERADEIAALAKNTGDLEAENERNAGTLASLRDELALRNKILADLEIRFAQSQSECESAQLHMTALKSPRELEAIEQASNKLAAELEQEGSAREAAENELATAAASVEELSDAKQELQAAVDDLKADLEAGIKAADERADEIKVLAKNTSDLKAEIERKSGELAERDEALAGLEMQLQASQKESELSQLHVAALKSPQELEAVRTAADELAAELSQEGRAREVAEKELAIAATAVVELGQSKQELQALVDDLNTDLEAGIKVADEQAEEIKALAKRNSDLNAENERNSGELAARDKALAGLERQLGALQEESELAQLHMTVLMSQQELEAVRTSAVGVEDDNEMETGELTSRDEALASLQEQLRALQEECEMLRHITPAIRTDKKR